MKWKRARSLSSSHGKVVKAGGMKNGAKGGAAGFYPSVVGNGVAGSILMTANGENYALGDDEDDDEADYDDDEDESEDESDE